MENCGLISVIVPVYRVEKYLEECIDSIIGQTYPFLEVILVDDGSPDGCGAICDRYAQKDPRVIVVHQRNSGAAAARNAALRLATGACIAFVDSDDYLEPDVYGYMLQRLQEEDADAVQFSFRDVYTNRVEPQYLEPCVMNEHEYLVRFTKDWTCALLWNKLYKRSLFEGVFFEEGHKIDDEYFTYRGFLNPCKVVFDGRIIYNYRKRASGVMGSAAAGEQRILDCIDSIVKRRKTVVSRWPELRRAFDENYLDAVWYLSENDYSTERTITVLKGHLKRYFSVWGNSIPPRYLWKHLWALYRTDTAVLLERCRQNRQADSVEDYFA